MAQKDEVIMRGYALCPLDGRYGEVGQTLGKIFSEYAWMEYRIEVECMWLEYLSSEILCRYPEVYDEKFLNQDFECIREGFNNEGFKRIKEIQDTKTDKENEVEIFIGERLDEIGKGYFKPLIHIGCANEDVNFTTLAMMLKDGIENVFIPAMWNLMESLKFWISEYADLPMLIHINGQLSTTTTLGKEQRVFYNRLAEIIDRFSNYKYFGKWSGSAGNYSAISVVFPHEDWILESENFLKFCCGVELNPVNNQIGDNDWMGDLFTNLKMVASIVLDIDKTFCGYNSKNYIGNKSVKGGENSQVIIHHANSFLFRSSEACCKTGIALLNQIIDKFWTSRMQSAGTENSTIETIGMALGYIYQAMTQTKNGLQNLSPDKKKILEDLEDSWEVLVEPIRTMLHKYGMSDTEKEFMALTAKVRISKEDIQDFVKTLKNISEEDKKALSELTPSTYIGMAKELAED